MNDHNTTTPFGASVALVLQEIKTIKALHRLAHIKRLQFAIDVCLVAHGVRTGYLVDAVCPPNPIETFRALLMALRGKPGTVFKSVVFWHHTPTMQTFLVHVPLLQEKITALLGSASGCVFIKLDKSLSMSRDPPDALREALYGMSLNMTESPDVLILSLSELFAEKTLIPLAAVLVDYPVAYCPAFPAQTSFLEGEALDVYTVSFKWTIESLDSALDFGREHVLLKFSCPQVLACSYAELSSSTLIRRLHVKFAPTLERIGTTIFVAHHTESLERVAL